MTDFTKDTLSRPMSASCDRQDFIDRAHTAGREFYDTPGSVRGCACEDCNRSRRIHGRPEWRWTGRFSAKRVIS